MSITVNVSASTGGTLVVTPTAAGGSFDVGTVTQDEITLSVVGGIGPPGLGNLMLAEGDGIDIATVGNVATISTNLTIPANLADLADISAAAPSAGQVLEWNGTQWAPGTDSTLSLAAATPSNLGTAAAGTGTAAARDDHVHAMPGLGDLTDVTLTSPASGEVLTWNGSAWTAAADSTNLTGYATESFVASAVANLVDSSPAALDTLAELAFAIGSDANFSTTITNSLAGKANISHTHDIADVTGLQSALDDKAATASLATVATSGNYSDLSGIPSDFTPAAHNHTSADITDFPTAAAGNAPIQSVNNATGNIVIANGTGLTLTENGSTLTLAAALPPSNLADLADVSGTPITNQALIYTGTEWQPGNIPAGTTVNGLSGSVVLTNGTGLTLTESGQTLTLSAVPQAGDVDGGTFVAAGNVRTEAGSNIAAESGDTLTVDGLAAVTGDNIQLLRSSVAGVTPTSLLAGELAINTEDGLLYWQRANGTMASAEIGVTLATVATSGSYNDLSNLPTLGTAAATDATDYATAAQGTLADSAVQPGDLAAVATSGSYSDLSGTPSNLTPISHASTHSTGGSDAIAPSDIGAAPTASPTFTGVITVAAGSAAAPAIVASGDSNTGIAFPAADTFVVSTGGLERLRVGSDGLSTFTFSLADAISGGVNGMLTGSKFVVYNKSDSATHAAIALRARASDAAVANIGIGYGTDASDGYLYFRIRDSGTTNRLVTVMKANGAVRFVPLAADPASGEAGDVYYNSTTNKLRVYNGTSWVDLH